MMMGFALSNYSMLKLVEIQIILQAATRGQQNSMFLSIELDYFHLNLESIYTTLIMFAFRLHCLAFQASNPISIETCHG